LPFLRFTRDKRGYETTLLVHAGRRNGRSRQRILYWFRTPPGVKVGRPALDEEAIRWIEEHNPDIEFDWPKILEAKPHAAPAPPTDMRRRQVRRPKVPGSRVPSSNVPVPKVHVPELPLPEPSEPSTLEPEPETMELEPEPGTWNLEPEPEPLAQAFEQLTHPETEEQVEPPTMPAQQNLGREQLTRLRARYAELLARIAERGGDAERIEALRAQAEPLNPDTWVTDAEVRQGLESFEPKIRDLRAALGLRRRRRSRRGGRRRGAEKTVPPQGEPDSSEG
jgi:hypothetical protein